MDGGEIWIVEQEDVIGEDALFVLEALQDTPHGESPTGHVPRHGLARGKDVSVGPVERSHVIVLLRRVHGSPDAFERRAHLLGDLVEPVREDLESHRVHSLGVKTHMVLLPGMEGRRA